MADATRAARHSEENARRAQTEEEYAQRARAEEQRRQHERREDEERRRREHFEEERRRVRTLEDLHRLTGSQFEALIGHLFEMDGYNVRYCGGSGDEGIDVILQMGQSKDVVQCKRWKADIGSPVVRDFYGALMHAGARHGFIITTASFSQSARSFALGKPITLLSGSDILSWLGRHPWEEWEHRRDEGAGAHGAGEARLDPYAVLGVQRGASQDEIRAAYRSAMAKYHPDKVNHLGVELQELAQSKAVQINQAYQMLSR